MDTPLSQKEKVQRGAEDSGRYFRHMMEFVGFTPADSTSIRESALVIEKHIPNIVSAFYANLLRYPPTRKHFLKTDGTIDQDYLQKRMHHLSNFWRRTASGEYDEEYARYIDYVGRAHTSHGADPSIYIAERYVIGQVGFMQHAINRAISEELREYNPELEIRAIRAWNMLMMVVLEMLARAYGYEHEAENYEKPQVIDGAAVQQLAVETYEKGLGLVRPVKTKEIFVGRSADIPAGERKIIQVDSLSIGVFHHKGQWVAIHNHCLHQGGPVATGCLEDDTITCPWHGFQYNVTNGELLVDPGVKLEMYPVRIEEGNVYLTVPDPEPTFAEPPAATGTPGLAAAGSPVKPALAPNEFWPASILPGKTALVHVDGLPVAVYNIGGVFYATQNACTHVGGPLDQGKLQGETIICPWHGSCFNVISGAVQCGPAEEAVQTFRVILEGDTGRVER